ncbi:protein FAM216A-like [Asterias rubens]|uniref:protein FAM216A-like n=1 Tax=Asterias rubens TaxID=7604 RepID=UPI0014559CC9|nr:protein FAM216A-like [Asterias rubens]
MSTSGRSSSAKRSASRHQQSPGASQSSGVLLPRRPKQHNHQPSLRKHRRSHTAPQYTERSLSSCSSSSIQSGEETNRSSCSSDNGQDATEPTYSCHISCRVSPDKPEHFEFFKPYSVYRAPLKQSKSLPSCFSDSYTMQHPDLDNGQKTYLWHTASVYSMSNMKALQQRRYKQLLQHQVDIGFHTQEECDRYLQYLLKARKRQFIADPSVWREPPKIPVRQKSSTLPRPSRAKSHRDYRYYPRGYEDTKGQRAEEDGRESRQEKNVDEREDQSQEATDEGKGHIETGGHDDSKGQTEVKGKDDVEKDEGKEGGPQETDAKSDSDDDDKLSESMQGVSLYYDPQRKTTVTRGKKEKDGKAQENSGDEDGQQKSEAAKTSHQNCFWGSH